MENQKCERCGQEFQYLVTSMGVPGGKDKEFIYCPYCNTKNGYEITSGFVFSYPINKSNEDECPFYIKQHKK